MKRISVNLTPEQIARLKERAAESGVPQSEQIRRAINLAIFGDAQSAKETRRPATPVLFTPKVETR